MVLGQEGGRVGGWELMQERCGGRQVATIICKMQGLQPRSGALILLHGIKVLEVLNNLITSVDR